MVTQADSQAVLERCAASAGSSLPLPRALPVFAHSDDEVIAVGGRMEHYQDSLFVCVTDGTLPEIGTRRASQADVLKGFLIAQEKFRIAPAYCFTKPLHSGLLNYECRHCPLTGPQFQKFAAEALCELGLI